MKITSLIAAVLLAGTATTGIVYAEDTAAVPKAADAPMDKAATKPHSHVKEKTGTAPSAPKTKVAKPNAAKDKSKHFHPRDGK